MVWETLKPALQPHQQNPMDPWPLPMPWRNSHYSLWFGLVVCYFTKTAALLSHHISEVWMQDPSMKESLQPVCSSRPRVRCMQVYPRCHITSCQQQNHPATADRSQGMSQASASPVCSTWTVCNTWTIRRVWDQILHSKHTKSSLSWSLKLYG